MNPRGSRQGSGRPRSSHERPPTAAQRPAHRRPRQAHLGDIEGAFGRISVGEVGERHTWKPRLLTLAAIVGPGHHRHGRRQRRRRCLHLRPGRAELPHHPAVDAAAADPGADRQPGDGGPARSGHRRRPCPAHQRALRPRLGLVQRRGPFSPQLPDHRHRVHRHLPGRRLRRRLASTSRCRSLRWRWWRSWRPAASEVGAGHVRLHRHQPGADPDVLPVPSALGHASPRTSWCRASTAGPPRTRCC